MELRQIHYVLQVARYKNFSKAAESMYVTQPAISQQIRALEAELSITLFERDTHGVKLTPDGERFIKYANDVIQASDRLLAAFNQSTTSNKEYITIGVFPFFKTTNLRKTINSFFASTANVMGNLKVMENYEAYESVRSGKVDFAIIKSRMENIPTDISYEILDSERLCVLVNKDNPSIQGDHVDVADLWKFPLLTGDNSSSLYNEMRDLYADYNMDFNVSFLNTLETDIMLDMVEDGQGILLMTEGTAKLHTNDRIVALPLVPEQNFHVFLIYPKSRKLRGKVLLLKDHILHSYLSSSK